MKKLLKAVLILIGIIVTGIAILVFSFINGMKPDEKEEEKVIALAEDYIEENYDPDQYEIFYVLYDNMGNFPEFEYAAKVRELDSKEEFLIYYNDITEQVEDSRNYPDEF